MKLIIFGIIGLIAIYCAFWGFDALSMIEYYQNYIYYLISINFILWLVSLIKDFGYEDSNLETSKSFKLITYSFFKNHWVALVISFILMLLSSISCKPDYRVLGDEPILLGISQSLYESRKCSLSDSSLENYDGTKLILVSVLDKRPIFFPYMVSVVHSLLGYRPENIFIFNFITGFLSLFLLYYIIQLIWGKFWGINGIICLASYPLFIVYANSAGFDVFNMMCSLVFFVCVYKFIKSPNAIRAEILLLWVPLFSQSRYESVLSLLVALPILLYYLPKKEYSNLGVGFIVSPLFFVPSVWLRLLTNKASDWQVNSGESIFSLEWFCENIKKAVYFFTAGEKAFGVIPLISVLALIGFIMFISDVFFKKASATVQNAKSLSFRDYRIFWGSVLSLYLLHAFAKFSYKLSDLTEVLATRHAIIFLPLFVIMSISFLYQFNLKYGLKKYYSIILMLLLLVIYWPEAVFSNCGVLNTPVYLELRDGRKYIEANYPNKKDYIIITDKPNFYVPFGYSSVSYKAYNNAFKNIVMDCFRNKYCSFLLVIQILKEDMTPFKGQEKLEGFEYETIFETCFIKGTYYRISKCVPSGKYLERH